MKKQICALSFLILPGLALHGLTNFFWYQDRPLVGLPPMPSQYYRPPDNDLRRCYDPCQQTVQGKRGTIMEYNFAGNDYTIYPDHKQPNDIKTRKMILHAIKNSCKN